MTKDFWKTAHERLLKELVPVEETEYATGFNRGISEAVKVLDALIKEDRRKSRSARRRKR